jgi:diguanylate cyclase (GGDEF)-like protein
MGGDEFVIISPNMTADAARDKGALLSALAQQASRQVCGERLLSLSVGAAFYPRDGSDAEQILAEADKKMYLAKQLHYENRELASPGAIAHAPQTFWVSGTN